MNELFEATDPIDADLSEQGEIDHYFSLHHELS